MVLWEITGQSTGLGRVVARDDGWDQPAAERFGLDRKTVREWQDRAKAAGEAGLVPRYPKRRARRIPEATVSLIEQARREFGWGCCRTRI